MPLRFTSKAKADLIEIYQTSVETFGMVQAEAYQDQLERAFHLLAANPRLARERTEIAPPVRIHPCGSHVIIYSIEAEGVVLIIRIRHGREDWVTDPGGAAEA